MKISDNSNRTCYPDTLVNKVLSEVKFEEKKSALQQKEKTHKKILPFVTQYHPAVPNLKKILMSKWHLIQNQPLLREIYKEPPIISYKRGKYRSKIYSFDPKSKGKEYTFAHNRSRAGLSQLFYFHSLSRNHSKNAFRAKNQTQPYFPFLRIPF